MLYERFLGLGSDELKSSLSIWTHGNAGTNLAEGWRRFIDMDVDVRMMKETEREG